MYGLTVCLFVMLMDFKNREKLRMGGDLPSNLLIPMEKMLELAKNPLGFVLAVALEPDYRFTSEELIKLEALIKGAPSLNRMVMGSVVVWTTLGKVKEAVWTGKAGEGVIGSVPYIIGGHTAFWPLPLQRDGLFSTMMWKADLIEDPTITWMERCEEALEKELGEGVGWALTRRYELHSYT